MNYRQIAALALVAISAASVASYYIYNSLLTTRPFNESGAYTEPAYNLYKYGQFVDFSSKGIFDMDKFTYWVPPLHSVFQLPFYILFGYGLWQIVAVQIAILALTIVAIKKFSRFLKIAAIIPVTLLLTNRNFIVDSLVSRPDTLATLFGVLAILFTLKLQKNKTNKSMKYVLLVGVSLGLSCLSYQLGAVYALSIGIYMFLEKQLKIFLKIIFVAVLTILPYALYVAMSPQVFLQQSIGIYRINEVTSVKELLQVELSRYIDFVFYAPAFALLFLFALYKGLTQKNKGSELRLLLITVIAILVVLFVETHKISFQMILAMPFMTLLIALYVKDMRIVTIAALVNFALVVTNIYLNLPTAQNPSFLNFAQQIDGKTNDTILSYPTFFPVFREKLFSIEAVKYERNLNGNVTLVEIIERVKPVLIVLEQQDVANGQLPSNYKISFNITRSQPSLYLSLGAIDRSLVVYKRV
jgi:hypothetical protein